MEEKEGKRKNGNNNGKKKKGRERINGKEWIVKSNRRY